MASSSGKTGKKRSAKTSAGSNGANNSTKAKKPVARSGRGSGSGQGRLWSETLASRGVVGVILLAVGVFFTAAFVTGQGALLGDIGSLAATRSVGIVGYALAPLAALVGLLVLVDALRDRWLVGGALILLSAVISLAAFMPPDQLFNPAAYAEYGGIVGSGVFYAVRLVGGMIGAVIVLISLLLVGLALLTSLTLSDLRSAGDSAVRGLGSFKDRLSSGLTERRERRAERKAGRQAERRSAATRAPRSETSGNSRRHRGRSGDQRPGSSRVEQPRPEEGRRVYDQDADAEYPPVEPPVEEDVAESEPSGAADAPPAPESASGAAGKRASRKGRGSSKKGGEREPESAGAAGAEAFQIVLPEPGSGTGDRGDRGDQGGGGEAGDPALSGAFAGDYTPPPVSLLKAGRQGSEHDAEETSRLLTGALADLGVEARVIRAVVGPRVTRYELSLGSGVKVSRVKNLQQDIAYALAATEVRILAPIPGKSAVGVEVPNTRPAHVTLGDVFQEYPAANDWKLPVAVGKDISGRAQFIDLGDMPHLLIAGTTGSGKSVMLNGMLTSLLLTTDPREVKMVLIDPKRVELSQFAKVPHLITPVVTDVKRASNALSWAVAEMDRRYEVLEKMGVRSLEGYNERSENSMPYVVIVIDELADLMMTAAAKVEDAVIRLAQKARAVGIHLVVATQRPSVDVITGMIKANIPSRMAFAVSSQVDSRVIMDGPGAEALLGMGDMLFKPVSASRPYRVQGAYISESEVEEIVDASAERARQRFIEDVTAPQQESQEQNEPEDDLLRDAASFVVSTQQASVSAIQRRFRVGYSRAGRIVDALERKVIVGPYEGSKSRSVVAAEHDLPILFGEQTPGEDESSGSSEIPSGGGEDEFKLEFQQRPRQEEGGDRGEEYSEDMPGSGDPRD